MNITKLQVKLAIKIFGKKNLQQLAKLSKQQFHEKVKSNSKSKHITDDMIDIMYDEIIKQADKL